MKAVVAAFNQEKALVGAFSVITNLRMELFQALMGTLLLAHHNFNLVPTQPQYTATHQQSAVAAKNEYL